MNFNIFVLSLFFIIITYFFIYTRSLEFSYTRPAKIEGTRGECFQVCTEQCRRCCNSGQRRRVTQSLNATAGGSCWSTYIAAGHNANTEVGLTNDKYMFLTYIFLL